MQSLELGVPIAKDELISRQLNSLLTYPGCLPIVAAGNTGNKIDNTPPYNCLIVGGIHKNSFEKSSNYGPGVSCYFPGPITVDETIYAEDFEHSSAATAALTGVAMLVQNYCAFKGYQPTGTDLVSLFRKNGKNVRFRAGSEQLTGIIPEWAALKKALDTLFSVGR